MKLKDINQLVSEQRIDQDRLLNGTAEIRDGQLIINPPCGFNKFPIIMAGEHVDIFQNGQKIKHPIVVSDPEAIHITLQDTEPCIDLKVNMSTDKLSANLNIIRIPGKKYILMDCQPMTELKISAKCYLEEEPAPLEFDSVMTLLHEQGVVLGIDEEAVRHGIKSKERVVVLEVARGVEPGESEDATIMYNLGEERDDGQITNPYRDGKINSVSAGTILAIKRPLVQGTPGMDVMGQPVLPRTPRNLEIKIKNGAKLINDGTVAVATRAGRPVLEGFGKQYLSVHPVYVVQGNVDINVGNIEFEGDIVVTGSVLDGFTVKAGGSIQVKGDVMHAFLYANGDISVANKVISSKLQAGYTSLNCKKIHKQLQQLSECLEDMITALKIIKIHPSFSTADLCQKGDGQLIQLLIDFKFKDVPKLVQDLIQTIVSAKKEHILPEVVETAQLLGKNLCNLGPIRIKEDSEINALREKVVFALERLDLLVADSANISLSYAQNSDIKASGNVTVIGLGVITSRIEAGGKITVERGVVRGGELIARDLIKVLELGSTQYAEVNVLLMDNASLEVHTVHPTIQIKHGSDMKIVQEHKYDLKAYIDNGHLSVI